MINGFKIVPEIREADIEGLTFPSTSLLEVTGRIWEDAAGRSHVETVCVTRATGGEAWLVSLGIGGVSLARSARRAMVYVRQRRRFVEEGA